MPRVDECEPDDEHETGALIEFEDYQLSPEVIARRKLAELAFRSHKPLLSRAFPNRYAAYDGSECVAIALYSTEAQMIASERRGRSFLEIAVFHIEAPASEHGARRARDTAESAVKPLTDDDLHRLRKDLLQREPLERIRDLLPAWFQELL